MPSPKSTTTQTGLNWLLKNGSGEPREIAKATATTRAWFGRVGEREVFAKWYPAELRSSWARIEEAIAGSRLHPAIVPLRGTVDCADGILLIYDRVQGESLETQAVRARFARLPLVQRKRAILTVCEALAAILAADFMIVDWYEGNMIYDFEAGQMWLFDWELCREGGSFTLEMDSNYGSSRLMAPEESVRGSRLDGTTVVYNLGRYASLNLPELAEPLAPVLARATYPARSERYQSVEEFVARLREAFDAASMKGA